MSSRWYEEDMQEVILRVMHPNIAMCLSTNQPIVLCQLTASAPSGHQTLPSSPSLQNNLVHLLNLLRIEVLFFLFRLHGRRPLPSYWQSLLGVSPLHPHRIEVSLLRVTGHHHCPRLQILLDNFASLPRRLPLAGNIAHTLTLPLGLSRLGAGVGGVGDAVTSREQVVLWLRILELRVYFLPATSPTGGVSTLKCYNSLLDSATANVDIGALLHLLGNQLPEHIFLALSHSCISV